MDTSGRKCRSCEKGPRGIEGHADLFVDTLGARMRFHCQVCGAQWIRVRDKEGAFQWSEVQAGEPPGELTPGRRKS